MAQKPVTITGKVKVDSNFRDLDRKYQRAAERALGMSAHAGAAQARALAQQRSRTGEMASITAGPVRRSTGGPSVEFGTGPFYARFHEWGTLGKRRKKLKQPGRRKRAAPPGSGVAPLGFMTKGRTLARKTLEKTLPDMMRRVR